MNNLYYLLKISLLSTLISLNPINVAWANESTQDTEQVAQKNLEYLLGNVLHKSKALQESYGDFAPYGAALFQDGSVKYVWYAKPGQTVKEPAQSLPLIRRALQTQAQSEKIIGSAIIYKYKNAKKKQAQLTVELEYKTGLTLAFSSEMTLGADNNVIWGRNSKTTFEPNIFVLNEN